MVFDNNTTSLGSLNIPMAEGYDCSTGVAMALIESAQNDLKMFEHCVQLDAREIRIQNESSGVVMESQIQSLQEAAVGGIIDKIKSLFKKLIEKVKSIFSTLIAKLNTIFMKDKQLAKKYRKVVNMKNLDHMEVKWRNINSSPTRTLPGEVGSKGNFETFPTEAFDNIDEVLKYDKSAVTDFRKKYDTKEELFKLYTGGKDLEDFKDHLMGTYFSDDEPNTYELKDINQSGSTLCNFLENYNTNLKNVNNDHKATIKNLNDTVKHFDKQLDTESGKDNNDDIIAATKLVYDLALAYQTWHLTKINIKTQAINIEYKQYRAAFAKAITVNDEKLNESSILADAIAEAAANEVEDVISSALTKEQISKICNASKNVMDGGVSDDPSKLTYGQDCYTNNSYYTRTDGSVDSSIVGTKEGFSFDDFIL